MHSAERTQKQMAQLASLDFAAAALRLKNIAMKTPLQFSRKLSKKYQAEIYLKREDLQSVSAYIVKRILDTKVKFFFFLKSFSDQHCLISKNRHYCKFIQSKRVVENTF